MTSESLSLPVGRVRRLGGFKPPWRVLLVAIASLLALLVGSTAAHLATPAPTGALPVGRDRVVLVDPDRPETHTAEAGDLRSVPIQLWYPAEGDTGTPAAYVDGLAEIADGLKASGALGGLEVAALPLVRTSALDGATISDGSHPVIVLSPGNQTNVAFYAFLAEELASHGHIVIGVDHPFQVAATTIAGGEVAVYDSAMDTGDITAAVTAKIDERVADVMFVLDALRAGDAELAPFAASADLSRIGVLGHSNGGLTAFEVCRADPTLDACLNLDGQGAEARSALRSTLLRPPCLFST